MWNWILKIWDFIRAILAMKAGSAEQQQKENEELEKKRQELEAQVEEKYNEKEQQVPTDGEQLVDYWTNRGVQPKTNDPATNSSDSSKAGASTRKKVVSD
jgi:hypothetical protein